MGDESLIEEIDKALIKINSCVQTEGLGDVVIDKGTRQKYASDCPCLHGGKMSRKKYYRRSHRTITLLDTLNSQLQQTSGFC